MSVGCPWMGSDSLILLYYAGQADLEYCAPPPSTEMISFGFSATLCGRSYSYSHVTDGKTKAQRGKVVTPVHLARRKILKHGSAQRSVLRKWKSGKTGLRQTQLGKAREVAWRRKHSEGKEGN